MQQETNLPKKNAVCVCTALCLLCQGQLHVKSAARAFLALKPYFAMLALHYLLADREAQAHRLFSGGAAAARRRKRLKFKWLHICRYTQAMVFDGYKRMMPLACNIDVN